MDLLIQTAEEWRAGLASILNSDQPDAEAMIEAAVAAAPTAAAFRVAQSALAGLRADANQVARKAADLARLLERTERQWRVTRRYRDSGLAELIEELGPRIADRPLSGVQRWLKELLAAFDAGEPEGARAIAAAELPFPEEFREGVEHIRAALRDSGDRVPLELLREIADGEVPGWRRRPRDSIRAAAHRLAGCIALREHGSFEESRRHLDAAASLDPAGALTLAERASLNLLGRSPEKAVKDAQRVIAEVPDEGLGYMLLGACSEQAGDFEQADQLYAEALARRIALELSAWCRASRITQPTGRLLLRAGESLLRSGRAQAALELLDLALTTEVLGPAPYPEADVYRVRSQALEQIQGADRLEIAAAAYEAGQRYLWNSDADRAVQQLRRACELGADRLDVGWLFADALLLSAFRPGDFPHQDVVEEALKVWEAWTAKVGPPPQPCSWAYVTRAFIADDLTNRPERVPGRLDALWDALGWLRRALMLDESDALRWAGAAMYLRNVDLPLLAVDAIERAEERNPTHSMVMTERQACLAAAGRFDEAARAGEAVIEQYGATGWVNAIQAWIVVQLGDAGRAIELLDLSLGEGYDPGWYRTLLAFCQLRLGDVDAARATYRSLRDDPGSAPVATVALAHLVLRDLSAAEETLELAEGDPTSRDGEILMGRALLALARDDVAEGERLLERFLDVSPDPASLDSDAQNFLLVLDAVVEDVDRRSRIGRAAKETIDRVLPARREALAASPRTAEEELEEALEAAGESDHAPILLAIRAGRAESRHEWATAADAYTEVLSSPLAPEAQVALVRTLQNLRAAAANDGRVDIVDDADRRLQELGHEDRMASAMSRAAALAQAKRLPEATQYLEAEIEGTTDPWELVALQDQRAELQLAAGDLDGAARSYAAALETAAAQGAMGRVAQQHTRLALIAAALGDAAGTTSRLREALAAWAAADAYEAEWALAQELAGVAAWPGTRALYGQAGPVLTDVLDALAAEAEIDPAALFEFEVLVSR